MICDDDFDQCTQEALKNESISENILPRNIYNRKTELPKNLLQCIKENQFCVTYGRMGCSKKFMDCSLKALKRISLQRELTTTDPSVTDPVLFFVSQADESIDESDATENQENDKYCKP